jgi:hypothetical protein
MLHSVTVAAQHDCHGTRTIRDSLTYRPLSQVGSRRKRCPGQFGQDGMGSIPATPSTKHLFHERMMNCCLKSVRKVLYGVG